MLPSFSAAWYKKSEERAKHADTAERLNETLSLFLKKRSQSFICLPDEVLGPSLFWRFDTTITQKKICISVLFSKQTNWNLKREVRAPNNTVIPNQCALLSWESPSNLRLYSPKDGDCHTSDVGHWFAMTRNSITRQIGIWRTVRTCHSEKVAHYFRGNLHRISGYLSSCRPFFYTVFWICRRKVVRLSGGLPHQ